MTKLIDEVVKNKQTDKHLQMCTHGSALHNEWKPSLCAKLFPIKRSVRNCVLFHIIAKTNKQKGYLKDSRQTLLKEGKQTPQSREKNI